MQSKWWYNMMLNISCKIYDTMETFRWKHQIKNISHQWLGVRQLTMTIKDDDGSGAIYVIVVICNLIYTFYTYVWIVFSKYYNIIPTKISKKKFHHSEEGLWRLKRIKRICLLRVAWIFTIFGNLFTSYERKITIKMLKF